MNTIEEVAKDASKIGSAIVSVECLGITAQVGFNIEPDGFDPIYREFEPKKLVPMAKEYADFLLKMDPAKFAIRETPVEKNAGAVSDAAKSALANAKAKNGAAKKAAKADKK